MAITFLYSVGLVLLELNGEIKLFVIFPFCILLSCIHSIYILFHFGYFIRVRLILGLQVIFIEGIFVNFASNLPHRIIQDLISDISTATSYIIHVYIINAFIGKRYNVFSTYNNHCQICCEVL